VTGKYRSENEYQRTENGLKTGNQSANVRTSVYNIATLDPSCVAGLLQGITVWYEK
jgi:hypothetical protein